MSFIEFFFFKVLTILSSDTGVWLTVAQLAETGGTAAAGDGGPAPAGLFLPQSGAGHRHPLGAGDTAGQAWDAAPAAAAGHCYLSRARLLGNGWGWKEWAGRGKDILAGKVTERLQKKGI